LHLFWDNATAKSLLPKLNYKKVTGGLVWNFHHFFHGKLHLAKYP